MINRIEKTYRELKSQGKEIIKLFSGNPCEEGFLFPPEILQKSYSAFFEKQIYQPHSKGLLKARQAIAFYYAKNQVELNPEHLLLTSGTSESFFYLFSYLAKAGENILTPNPAYPLFDYIANLSGIELRHYPLLEEKKWSVDLEALKKKTDEKTKAIVLVSPNNPTGSVVSASQIQEITEWANLKNIPLICDEVFSEFCFSICERGGATGGPPISASSEAMSKLGVRSDRTCFNFPRPMKIAKPKLCFTLNGISKMFALPAMKLSWIAVTGENDRVEAAVDALETTADTFLSCHTAIQETLPVLFSEGWRFVESYREEVRQRRELALNLLQSSPKIEFVVPDGAFYLMFKLKNSAAFSSEEEFVIQLMKRKGVFVHPGYFYDYEDGIHGVISFLCSPEKLEKGLKALLDFIP